MSSHKLDHLHLMRLLVAIVQFNSFAKAAEHLSITATKASKDIRHLEQSLQVTLLHRTTRAVSLTDSGEQYYQYALQILQLHQQMLDSILNLKTTLSGELRISAPSLWGKIILTPLILEFKQQHPKVNFIASYSNANVDILRDNIHIAFRSTQLRDEPYIARFISEDNYSLCASSSYLENNPAIHTLEDLDNHQFISLAHPSGTFEKLNFICEQKIVAKHLAGQLAFSNKEDILRAVKQHFGIAVLPSYLVADDINKGELQRVLAKYPLKPAKFYALYTQKRKESALVNQFIDFVIDNTAP